MRDQFIKTLCEIAEGDERIMLITGDLGFGVFDEFRKRFPDQFINAGIAEQNMTLVATGMALEGRIVFTYSIANFPTLRCLEMIRNDAAYHNADVKIIAIGGGFSYGALGVSHHATEDFSILRSLPEVTCLSPTCRSEVDAATRAMVDTAGTCFMRLDKDPGLDLALETPFKLGVPRRISKGLDIAIFTTGGIISEVYTASQILKNEHGLECSLYSIHTFKPVDSEKLVDASRLHRLLVTVEEHTLCGGLGSLVLESLADKGALPKGILRIGLGGVFSSIVGSQKYLRKKYLLDANSIVERILNVFHETVRRQ